jgi:hypothetical protein
LCDIHIFQPFFGLLFGELDLMSVIEIEASSSETPGWFCAGVWDILDAQVVEHEMWKEGL